MCLALQVCALSLLSCVPNFISLWPNFIIKCAYFTTVKCPILLLGMSTFQTICTYIIQYTIVIHYAFCVFFYNIFCPILCAEVQ